ncbi:MAG: tRNA pseudouridine(55) synthase TruB [Candidatus Pacebacteria bacterium]|nr:tRNA pseudouridine(55) synthase TruB [Candidatus Paceibacterota bacterium]
MHGLFVFNKPTGVSSAGFLNHIKRVLSTLAQSGEKQLRIGHGGTLDPFATGVLIVGVGREYTRLLHDLLNTEQKEYQATIILGADSDTDDCMGIITPRVSSVPPSKEDIKKAVAQVAAQETQTPPAISAVKIHGVPAYARVRRGESVSLSQKSATVFSYSISSISLSKKQTSFSITLRVSSGFYIRSFARDIGNVLGVGGYVSELKRLSVGEFSLFRALDINEVLSGKIELFARISGGVQGVGFRSYALKMAQNWPITGFVRNSGENSVEIVAQGYLGDLGRFLDAVKKGPQEAHIESVFDYFRKPSEVFSSFELMR